MFSYASAMKQVPTAVPMHSVNSLSSADLSVFDSIDSDVLEDYAVSLYIKLTKNLENKLNIFSTASCGYKTYISKIYFKRVIKIDCLKTIRKRYLSQICVGDNEMMPENSNRNITILWDEVNFT